MTKKIEKDEDYVAAMQRLSGTVEHAMRQNAAIDIYEDFFTGTYTDHTMEAPSAKQLYVFRCVPVSTKLVSLTLAQRLTAFRHGAVPPDY